MLAEIVLETGGVCYGCAGEMINGEYRANHIRVTNVDELQSILNSKYRDSGSRRIIYSKKP